MQSKQKSRRSFLQMMTALWASIPFTNRMIAAPTARWVLLDQDSQVLAVHAALLHTEQIIYFSGSEHDRGQHDRGLLDHTRLFDCTTMKVEYVRSPTTDVFCSGHCLLEDGRLLVAGGTQDFVNVVDGEHHIHFPGLRNTWIFDPIARKWTEAEPMNKGPLSSDPGTPKDVEKTGGRWYPTLITLKDGSALAMSGHPGSSDARHHNNTPEVFNPGQTTSGKWSLLKAIGNPFREAYYPRLHVLPGEDVFCSTPVDNSGMVFRFSLTGTERSVDKAPDGLYHGINASSVLLPLLPEENYRPRVLLCGDRQPWIIDLGDRQAKFRKTSERKLPEVEKGPARHSKNSPRYDLNAVLLPTRDVFVCGGVEGADGRGKPDETGVLAAELYHSSEDRWSVLPAAKIVRNYHSIALLMPDGRVWTAGSNHNAQQSYERNNPDARWCKDRKPERCDYRELAIEIFEPDYFQRSDRPLITKSPAEANYGLPLEIRTPQARSISRVALIRAGSVTHAFNSDQRYVGLSFERTGGETLMAKMPFDPGIAPPGYYLLFLLDRNNVPSVGKFLQVKPFQIHRFWWEDVARIGWRGTVIRFPPVPPCLTCPSNMPKDDKISYQVNGLAKQFKLRVVDDTGKVIAESKREGDKLKIEFKAKHSRQYFIELNGNGKPAEQMLNFTHLMLRNGRPLVLR